MKTIIEWLGEIEDSAVRTKALKNLHHLATKEPAISIGDALIVAFNWNETEEGEDYWHEVYYTLVPEEDRS